ncbi:MAG: DUF2085 domain-containing protein [Candidatus Izimaplasma sp.]|nr:DUF2085 domain-containing protein [Candidatus Izimaplasma bacterium]
MKNYNEDIMKKRSGKDIIFLYLIILIIPVFAMVLLPFVNDIISQLLSIYFALVFILTFLTILSWMLKKQYLSIFFGCHQKKERSFVCSLKYLGVCSRCTGIYIGIFFSSILIILDSPWYIYLLIGIPLIIDGLAQHLNFYKSNNYIRITTGILFGPTLVFLFYLFHFSLYHIAYYFYSLF